MDLPLNHLQWLTCHKTKQNQKTLGKVGTLLSKLRVYGHRYSSYTLNAMTLDNPQRLICHYETQPILFLVEAIVVILIVIDAAFALFNYFISFHFILF